jgi:hypothetical protein
MPTVKETSMAIPALVSKGCVYCIVISLCTFLTSVGISFGAVVKGTIYDGDTGQPIPFATVRVEGTGRSMLANENGEYRLYLPEGTYRLKFSHVAHYSEQLSVSILDSVVVQDVYLHPAIIELPGVKIYERAYDPAQAIIREAIARKKQLLAMLRAYSFDAYSKLVVRDTAKGDSINILLLMENQLTSHWEYPNKYKEIVTARRYSANLEGMEVLTMVGELTNFNENRLDFEEYSVVSPTAEDALDHYNYYLLDTIFIDSQPVFRLEIEPRNNHEPLFAGFIDIADSSFAVVGVDVGFNEAFDFRFVKQPRYSQQYAQFENDLWMPVEIRFYGLADVPIPGIPTMSFDYVVALHNFTFNTQHREGTFDQYWYELAEDADKIDSATWNAGQLIPLTPDEIRGYQRIDSIHNAPKPLPKKLLSVGLGALFLGIGGQYEFFHFNRVEGAYLGAATTLDKIVPNTKFSLKSGYAFSGEYWQNNYGITYTLSKRRNLTVSGEYHDEITRRPTIISSSRSNPTFMAITNKTDPFDYFLEKGFLFKLNTRIVNHLNTAVSYNDYNQYSVSNNTEYSLFRDTKKHRLNPPIVEGKLRSISIDLTYDSRSLYKYKGKEHKSWSPSLLIVSAGAEVASPDFIENDFDFTRYRLWLYRRQQTFGLGTSKIDIYASASDKTLPPQKYFTVDFGSGAFDDDLYFKTLGETNFSGSRALTIYVCHDFSRILFRKTGVPLIQKIPFSLSIYGGAFWTDFKDHPALTGDENLHVAERPYAEIGFGLGRITPFDFQFYFTWQLSDYATNRFSFTIGSGFMQ